MQLTTEQIKQMAPDASSAAAGMKLAAATHWQLLGRDSAAMWGLCKGSALYQVRVDLSNLGYRCSCPSRKLPCKHVLALMLLAASGVGAIAESAPPEWVAEWLAKRKEKENKKNEPQGEAKPVDEQARKQRVEKREARIEEGLERLDLWLKDLVRNGFAGLESKPPAFWQEQAKRLVDAQAPGLATRVLKLSEIAGGSADWPSRMAESVGRLKLLVHASQRLDRLAPSSKRKSARSSVGRSLSPSSSSKGRPSRMIGRSLDNGLTKTTVYERSVPGSSAATRCDGPLFCNSPSAGNRFPSRLSRAQSNAARFCFIRERRAKGPDFSRGREASSRSRGNFPASNPSTSFWGRSRSYCRGCRG